MFNLELGARLVSFGLIGLPEVVEEEAPAASNNETLKTQREEGERLETREEVPKVSAAAAAAAEDEGVKKEELEEKPEEPKQEPEKPKEEEEEGKQDPQQLPFDNLTVKAHLPEEGRIPLGTSSAKEKMGERDHGSP